MGRGAAKQNAAGRRARQMIGARATTCHRSPRGDGSRSVLPVRMAIGATGLVTVTAAVISVLIFAELTAVTVNNEVVGLQHRAAALAGELRADIAAARAEVGLLAAQPVLREALNEQNTERVAILFRERLKAEPAYQAIRLIGLSETESAALPQPPPDMTSRIYGPAPSVKLWQGPGQTKLARMMAPVYGEGGATLGQAIIDCDLATLVRRHASAAGDGADLSLTDGRGDVLLPVAEHNRDNGAISATVSFSLEESDPATGLVLTLSVPRARVLGPMRKAGVHALLVSLGLTLAGMGIAGTAGRRLAESVNRLADAAETVGAGFYLPDLDIPQDRRHELGRLSAALRAMAHAVRDRERGLRERAARAMSILDSIPTALVTTNAKGRIESVNCATERLFGYGRMELLGRDLSSLIPQPAPSGESRPDGEQECDVLALRRDGTTFPAHLSIAKMRLRGGQLNTGVVTDLTELHRVERMKREFVSTVSHELRTPLTSIKGSLGLLRANAMGRLPDQARPLIDIAYHNSDCLVRIINDLLDVEKIEQGKMSFDFQMTAIRPLLERIVEANKGMAGQAGVVLYLEPMVNDIQVPCDPDRLAQVLTNLLSNAVKFSPTGEIVRITAMQNDTRLRITVKDNGPGIPVAFREQVFEKFAQADSSDQRRIGGTGLGLSIAKAIVEAHGGQIWFSCKDGEGTEFHVDLPGVSTGSSLIDRPLAVGRLAS